MSRFQRFILAASFAYPVLTGRADKCRVFSAPNDEQDRSTYSVRQFLILTPDSFGCGHWPHRDICVLCGLNDKRTGRKERRGESCANAVPVFKTLLHGTDGQVGDCRCGRRVYGVFSGAIRAAVSTLKAGAVSWSVPFWHSPRMVAVSVPPAGSHQVTA